jgi:hypothetical protein
MRRGEALRPPILEQLHPAGEQDEERRGPPAPNSGATAPGGGVGGGEERPPGPQFWGSRMRRGEALRPPILEQLHPAGEQDEERRGPPAPNSGGAELRF